jgi:hypothetical protein
MTVEFVIEDPVEVIEVVEGIPGPRGATGATGATGAAGAQGAKGDQGDPGTLDPDTGIPYITVNGRTTVPTVPSGANAQRFWIDTTEEVPLLKAEMHDGTELAFWPVYVIPHGGSVPSGLHPKTIILEKSA